MRCCFASSKEKVRTAGNNSGGSTGPAPVVTVWTKGTAGKLAGTSVTGFSCCFLGFLGVFVFASLDEVFAL